MRDRPRLGENALRVLERRYLARDSAGRTCETPEAMFGRVARTLADADPAPASAGGVAALSEAFFDAMMRLELLPNSPALRAGLPGAQLAACFVLPLEDDLGSIYQTMGRAALIHQSGGGTGFDFSPLRPARDPVRSTGGAASGPVSFLGLFDASTEVIRQGGIRRGANMGLLRVDHPDILEFVEAKSRPGRLTNFNLSVGMTDAFMSAAERGEQYDLVSPRDGRVHRRLEARKVLDACANLAWACGEPGMVFLDALERGNPTPHLGRLRTTNPCGEQPLLPYESCTLASIDLSAFCVDGHLDGDRLVDTVHLGVRMLDDILEANTYPFEDIERATLRTRKVGLGVMGFADLLVDLGVPYDDPRALSVAGETMSLIQREARRESARLAEERGSFPAWRGSRLERAGLPPQRNATVTTIAPTGTLSLLAGCSSGIEPLYALQQVRCVLGGESLFEEQPRARALFEAAGLDPEALFEAARVDGSLRGVPGVPPELSRRLTTRADLAPTDHLRMQAAFQAYVDNAVSKTVNLPEDAPPAAAAEVFASAWRLGLKGVTLYRQDTREGQVLQVPGRRARLRREAATSAACPDCQAPLSTTQRCRLCRGCGWSACIAAGG